MSIDGRPAARSFGIFRHTRLLWDNRLLITPGGPEQQWRKAALRVADCPNAAAFRRNT
jgi:hypothetical protein